MKITTDVYVYARFDPFYSKNCYLSVTTWEMDDPAFVLLKHNTIEHEVDINILKRAYVKKCEEEITKIRAEAQNEITRLTEQINSVLALEMS